MKSLLLIVLLSVFLQGCFHAGGKKIKKPKIMVDLPTVNLSIRKFSSCDELKSYAHEIMLKKRFEDSRYLSWLNTNTQAIMADSTLSLSSSSGSASNVGNRQEESVSEGDKIVVGEHHIYVSKPEYLEVIDRKSFTHLETIALEGGGLNNPLIVTNDRLYVFSQEFGETYADMQVKLSLYRINREGLSLLESKKFAGALNQVRELDGEIYLVTKSNIDLNDRYSWTDWKLSYQSDFSLEAIDQLESQGVDCKEIYKPIVNDNSFNLTHVFKIDSQIENLDSSVESRVVLGKTQGLYMSNKNLYLINNGVIDWFAWDERPQSKAYGTLITTIDLDDFNVKALSRVEGRSEIPWSFKEYGNDLVVATTTRNNFRPVSSNVFVLNYKEEARQYNISSKIQNIAPGESIKAVRYIEDYLYVVTFLEVDPLYKIDLSDRKNIKIVGQLKIPGFSTYMHPYKNKLLGIGKNASWGGSVQVSYFDISQDSPQLYQQSIYGDRGSESEVNEDHKAFYLDEENDIFAVPLVERDIESYYKFAFQGVRFFKLGENSFKSHGLVSHKELMPESCEQKESVGFSLFPRRHRSKDVSRVFKLDGFLYTVSQFGIMKHDLLCPEHIYDSVQFSSSDQDCYPY